MKYLICICFLFSCQSKLLDTKEVEFLQSEEVQLNAPIITANSTLFQDSMLVNLSMDYQEAKIFYTIDESEPTQRSLEFDKPFYLSESSILKSKTFHKNLLPSEISKLHFVKSLSLSGNIDSAILSNEPHPKYSGTASKSLFDLKKGSFDFTNSGWLGFDTGSLQIDLSFVEPIDLKTIKISMLQNHGSWIFLPKEIIARTKDNSKTLSLTIPTEDQLNEMRFIELELFSKKVKKLTLEIIGLDSIPEWHVGKGTIPWLFIDEIIID